jgi:predicted RecB family nuclease
MLLSEKDLLNYIKCPLYYKLEANGHNLRRDTFNTFLHDTANKYIKRVSSTKLLGKFDHEHYVKKHWDKVCMENQHIITPKQCIQGWGYLYKLVEFMNIPGIELLDSEITYMIEPEGAKHALTGYLDPIIKQGDFYTTLIISFSDSLPESYVMDMNLKHTIDAYALNQFIPNVQHCITYHSFKNGSEKDTMRFSQHFQRLEYILEVVGNCIEQDLIYPRNSYSCSTCALRGLCDKWIGGDKHD